MLTKAEISLLDRPLACKRVGCSGTIPNTWLRGSLALIEYGLRNDSTYRLRGQCNKCHFQSDFTYSDVYNAIRVSFRPTPLADDEFWALMLLEAGPALSGEGCFLGERVLIRRLEDTGVGWVGFLETTSSLTPSLNSGAVVGGRRFGEFRVCTGVVIGQEIQSLPLFFPQIGTADTGCFFTSPSDPDDLQSAQPFCANPRCPHIVGLYHSQFKTAVKAQASVAWLFHSELHMIVDCHRCGVSTVIDESSYNLLYHI